MAGEKVIIIGHGFSSRLGMIRTFGKMGCEVTVVALSSPQKNGRYRKPVDCYSKYVGRFLYSRQGDREGLVDLLLRECVVRDQRPLLIPDSDFAASTIDLSMDRLSGHFRFPHVDHTPGQVVAWMDKLRQKDLAREVGMHVAPGCLVRIVDGKYELPGSIQYPCFPKPLASAYGGKRGLRKCRDEKALRALLDGMRVKDMDVLVEDYVEISHEYAVVGFADRNKVVIPAVIYLAHKGVGAHVGVAKIGQLLPRTGFEELLGQFEDFVRRTHFTGLFDIDFYESEGTFYFGEMNMRYGASGYALYKAGINLPKLLYQSLSGLPLDETADLMAPLSYMNERVCLDDWFAGKTSTAELRKELKEKERGFVYDPDDPEPYRRMKRMIRDLAPRRMIRFLRKR